LWAAERAAELADNPLKRDEMREVARAFQVATPTMAFLVLESPSQYLRADIKPPKGFDAEWMEEYAEARKERDEYKRTERKERFEAVLEAWKARKTWWATAFAVPENYGVKNGKPRSNSAGAASPQAPRPPALSAPSASVQAGPGGGEEGGDFGDASEVIVTARRVDNNQYSVSSALSVSSVDEYGKPITLDIGDVLSDKPYIKALDAAPVSARLRIFAEQEKTYGALTAFWFETAEWFRLKGESALARQLLLSALELPTTDDETRLIIAFRLERAGEMEAAIKLLEAMAATTDFRPQPKRALALALAKRGLKSGKVGTSGDLERAFRLLTEVALDPQDNRYDGIEVVALMEANSLIPAIDAAGGSWTLDPRLVATMDTDVRVVIEWSNPDADIDLWVTEPSGERVSYSNRESEIGGAITNDMTNGYGPEEYLLRRAPGGKYKVQIDGYGSDRLNPNGEGRVMVRLFRNFGRPSQTEDLVDAEIAFEEGEDGENKIIASLSVPDAGKGRKSKGAR
jgi:hypothetical protein